MAVLLISTLSAPIAAEIVKYFMLVSSSIGTGSLLSATPWKTCVRPHDDHEIAAAHNSSPRSMRRQSTLFHRWSTLLNRWS
jgi:hypothetical protein